MIVPPPKDGRHAQRPYRVRAGETWYWVDPAAPREAIEPGDTVVVYPAGGHAVIAVVQEHHGRGVIAFANLEGERFEVYLRDLAAMHLAAVDDQQ
jgi:hypothetical protein